MTLISDKMAKALADILKDGQIALTDECTNLRCNIIRATGGLRSVDLETDLPMILFPTDRRLTATLYDDEGGEVMQAELEPMGYEPVEGSYFSMHVQVC